MLKVGIPRAFLYYNYYPLWKTFFEELGAKVVVSDPTTKKILDDGVKCCVDDACLPLKLFHGHVINLKDKADVIFVPRLVSVRKKEYICPKFCGLPDMVVNNIKGLPDILDVTVNMRSSPVSLVKAVVETGKYFTGDCRRIYRAFGRAVDEHREFEKRMESGLTPLEAMEGEQNRNFNEKMTIGLIGHPYNIYDSYSSMKLLEKLRARGIKIITQDMISGDIVDNIARNFSKPMFWSFGKKIMASAGYMTENRLVDGIIYLVAFGCGLDALVGDLVERKLRKAGIPFCFLTVDEHTGEAGIDTRIEAFIDMLERRNAV